MDIRNILNKKKEKKAKKFRFILFIIFCIGILYILGVLIYKDKTKTIYSIGEQVQLNGTIEIDNNYPLNTHKLIVGKNIFGIKSNTINLNYFLTDKVSVKGNIVDITHDFPILDISELTIPDKKIKVSNNTYTFTDDLLSLDFSQENEFYAGKEKNKITIYHREIPIIEISSFVCNKTTPYQDCESIIKSFIKNDNDMFQNYKGQKFYKKEEGKWLFFNDNTLGYILTTSDEDLLLNISHLIEIIDNNYILVNKNDFILKNCESGSMISSIEKELIDSNLIRLNIKLNDTNGSTKKCKLNINLFNDREIKNKSIE